MSTQIQLVIDGKKLESFSGWNIAVQQLQMRLASVKLSPLPDRRLVTVFVNDTLALLEAKVRLQIEAKRLGIQCEDDLTWIQLELACAEAHRCAERACVEYCLLQFAVQLQKCLVAKKLVNSEGEVQYDAA